MRHRVFGRRLDRDANHRKALFRNLVVGLIQHSRIRTTEAKAKAVRGLMDKLISKAKQGTLHARRTLSSFLHDPSIVNQLVDGIAPTLADRTSGYTRIIRLGERRGDDSPLVKLEFVNADSVTVAPKPKSKSTKKSTKKSLVAKQATPKTRVKTPVASKITNTAHRTQSKG